MSGARRASLATSRTELTLSSVEQAARRAFYEAARRTRLLVHQRGGYVPRALDKVASGQRGYKLADHMRTIVVPLHNAGYSDAEIHGLAAQLTYDVVHALLQPLAA